MTGTRAEDTATGAARGDLPDTRRLEALRDDIAVWAGSLGFSQIGVAGVDLASAEPGLTRWLADGFHGSMGYMAAHGMKRARPAELVPGTVRVITARMDYLPRPPDLNRLPHLPDLNRLPHELSGDAPGSDRQDRQDWRTTEWQRLADRSQATVSLYARGRDYHKVLRSRLQRLADRIAEAVGPFGHRVFTDSAPVLEVELAARSGLGWRGKHTLALSREAGSMFFLGEIYIDLPLPPTTPVESHCGSCRACIDICPTGAIVAPYRLDARRCISYLTIESAEPIPLELRPLIGNRIYGCDDCQLACPWNKFAVRSPLADFDPRAAVGDATLLQLWAWSEADFLRHTEGSAIRRIGFERWQRNLAVAIGNALHEADDPVLRGALVGRREACSELVREHIDWALAPLVT